MLKNEGIFVHIDKIKTTVSAFTLLQAMGITTKKILSILGGNIFHLESYKISKALQKLNKFLVGKDLNLLCFRHYFI